jgi:hypothetical protein
VVGSRVECARVSKPCFLCPCGRERVDGLRRERLLFDDVLRKAGRDWAAQRAEMVALIKAASIAHDQRQKVG